MHAKKIGFALLVTTFGTFTILANAAPSNARESTFLLSCRPPCERDAATIGISGIESKRKCDCYCRSIFQNLSNADFDQYARTGIFSKASILVAEASYHRCFVGVRP